ncbi:MAG: carboxypeptidase regulatory-like domain-containing protein, partial [Candidatus Thermoplasmatota archaeon]|nr:carboxypeptidase regulatory-like domain-containing protein [Candidatus Thermoplasmatota archaeon]
NWTWTFTDGGQITLQGSGPSYLFDEPGVFTVTLNVTDAAGNWHKDTMTVTVIDITDPVANAGEDLTVPVGTAVTFDGSLSTDNTAITGYVWTFSYDGEERTLSGVEATFTFMKGGAYEVLLTVSDGSGNTGEDTVTITVIDTGRVTGTVLDGDGKPVEGAHVEITASDGEVYATTTGADGSFSLEIPNGPFSWKVSKDGYVTVAGTGTVAAMGDEGLDLSGEPLVRQKQGSEDDNILLYLVIAAVIVLMAGLFLYLLTRRKGTGGLEEE